MPRTNYQPPTDDFEPTQWDSAGPDGEAFKLAVKQEAAGLVNKVFKIILVGGHLFAFFVCFEISGGFSSIFKTMGVELPITTQLLVLSEWTPYIVHGGVILFVLTMKYWIHDNIKQFKHLSRLCVFSFAYVILYWFSLLLPIIKMQEALRSD